MKSWQTWLNLILVLTIALMILFWPSKPDPTEITTLQQHDSAKQVQFDSVKRLNQSLTDDLQKKTLEAERVQDSLITLVKKKQARQVIIKPVVMAQTDSLPIVREYIARQDSIAEDLSNHIKSLEFELSNTTKTLLSIRANMETEIAFMQDKYKIALQEAEVYRKGWKKEQRKTKVWKVAAVVLGVGGLMAGSAL